MYDVHTTLAHLDAHKWAIMGLCSFAMVFNYIWFFLALRQAKRDQRYSVPAFTTVFWLVGDSTFVFGFHDWFFKYKDWYPELFWVALLFTVAFELAFTRQLLMYGRDELMPKATQQQFIAAIAVAVVVGEFVWWLMRHLIGDPLGITYFDLANVSGPIWAGALVLRRGHRGGQVTEIWLAYFAMAGIWYVAEYLWFGPAFRAAPYTAIAVVCEVAALAVAYLVAHAPAYDAATAADANSGAAARVTV
jgi:hypothetical protein